MKYTIKNIGQLLLMSGEIHSYAHDKEALLGLLEHAALAIVDGAVTWYGPQTELPPRFLDAEIIDASNGVLMPGLVDSHTHLVYAGSRELEYEMRASGITYSEIAKRGGGIHSTVAHTRAASAEQMFEQSALRLERMMMQGITTIEIKSGYGLDLETELRQLEVVEALKKQFPIEIVGTFLGAHDFPKGRSRKDYIEFLTTRAIPAVVKGGTAEFCDVFCDTGFFTVEESRIVLERARECGLKLKLHADELELSGGSILAAELEATSADHLICIDQESIEKMVAAQVVFTLLPATSLFLGKKEYAPARAIIDAGGKVALATDCNPGSSPCENLALVTTLACSQMKMSPAEALWAITRGGACALARNGKVGQIKLHGRADLALFDTKNYQEIPYSFGRSRLKLLFVNGRIVVRNEQSSKNFTL